MKTITVTVKHIRAADLCMGGARKWFEHHGFSWVEFLESGGPIEKFEATGDPIALRVTEIARKEAEQWDQS